MYYYFKDSKSKGASGPIFLIAYVSTTGNDGTAVLGNPSKPFRNVQTAFNTLISHPVSALHPGKISCAAGTYAGVFLNFNDGSPSVDWPSYIEVVGAGRGSTNFGNVNGANASPDCCQPGLQGSNINLISDGTITFGNITTQGTYGTGCGTNGGSGNISLTNVYCGSTTIDSSMSAANNCTDCNPGQGPGDITLIGNGQAGTVIASGQADSETFGGRRSTVTIGSGWQIGIVLAGGFGTESGTAGPGSIVNISGFVSNDIDANGGIGNGNSFGGLGGTVNVLTNGGVNGTINTTGGFGVNGPGASGPVTIHDNCNINNIDTHGQSNFCAAGNGADGGAVTFGDMNGPLGSFVANITASGGGSGDATDPGARGGNGGPIIINKHCNVSGTIETVGGDATSCTGNNGGRGGNVDIFTPAVYSTITNNGGAGDIPNGGVNGANGVTTIH